jgi:hypothetical protein
MKGLFTAVLMLVSTACVHAASKPPIYIWLEPEWFEGVEGTFAYWTGDAKPAGHWSVAGPGISPEWSQGGESEWNSMGAPADETKAECHRDVFVPRAGKYKIWVRFVEHRKKATPFTLSVAPKDKPAVVGKLGVKPVLPPNDEYMLYWGFSFAWDKIEGELPAGPARLSITIDKKGQAWRQVDAILITDDQEYTPVGREKPPFGYLETMNLYPQDGAAWRGSAKDLIPGASWKRTKLAGREFTMWTGIDSDPKWWGQQKFDTLTPYDVFFEFSPPADIKAQFHKQFAGKKDVPILSSALLTPGLYLGSTPDLSPDSPVRKWLEKTKMPFYILTNYANPQYTDMTGPATYQALAGPLADQFLGYIHGEAIGHGIAMPKQPLGKTRRDHVDALGKQWVNEQAAAWSKTYKTKVPPEHFAKGIACLSAESISLAHLYHENGALVVGYEEDATNAHVPMRIAFERGAARQFGGAWINYASGNFGDACNYFTQNPVVPRGAPSWFHSKYAVTDGVSISWYRKLYYLNYLGGASAIFWEQGLGNQWILPGPGTHPIDLSPFGRATEDFFAFVERCPDRGEPFTPIAFLLSYGHGYERVNNECKMLTFFHENDADRELRELLNVAWHPFGVVEGRPAAPDVQSMPSGKYGNLFDVLVDRPAKAKVIFDYPIVWAAGDVDLSGPWVKVLEEYLQRGGTLVVNIDAAKSLPEKLLGLKPTGKTIVAEDWRPDEGEKHATTPFEVAAVELAGAKPLAWAAGDVPLITRYPAGEGVVIVTLVPRLLGQDERAHPALPYLMNGLTKDLLPVEVRIKGERPAGEIMYQINRTKDGFLVLLVNNQGVDKTQNGIARVDRRAFVDAELRTRLPVQSAKELTGDRDLKLTQEKDASHMHIRVSVGDVQVVYLRIQR